jgi:steroid delta-isomerase-like uncharacterized protein
VTDRDPVSVLQAYVAAVNAGDYAAMAALCTPGFVHHSGAGDLDVAGVREGLSYYRAAFRDFRYDVENVQVVDGGSAVVGRWTMRGTHEGPFFGLQGTGREIASRGMSLHRVVDGLLVEDWEYNDDMGLMRGLGFRVVPPAPAPAPDEPAS